MSRGPDRIDPARFDLLAGALGGLTDRRPARARVVSATMLRAGVYRLALARADRPTVVVKRLRSRHAWLEQAVTDRWLTAAGLDGLAPPRLATVAEPDGAFVWHVYDDLGACGLDRPEVDRSQVEVAMGRLADLHAGFAGHLLLPEVRFAAGDLGVHFLTHSVRDAQTTVARLRPPALDVSADQAEIRDGVLAGLQAMRYDEPARVRLLAECGGPETLVHGDLTRANVFVVGERVRLIDWEHVGVAPAAFDVTTHVAHYAPELRPLVIDSYTAAMADRGFPYPEIDWDRLVGTFEAGRLANQLIWLSTGILEESGATFEDLAAWGRALAVAVGTTPVGPGVAP